MVFVRYAVLTLFACWLVASICNHFNASLRQRFWYFHLLFSIPAWTLFRSPATENLDLEFRDRLADGSLTEWRTISLGQRRTWITCLWNPELMTDTYLWTRLTRIRDSLLGIKSLDEDFKFAYAVVQSVIRAQPQQPTAEARQFRILRHSIHAPASQSSPLITSGFQPC